ncbi:MAG: hypothetical protein AB8G99_20350 [Planctomycetaceae bacterium]
MTNHEQASKQWFRVVFRNYELGIIDVHATNADAAYQIAYDAGPHKWGLTGSDDWDLECIDAIDAEDVENPYS